MPKKPRQLIVNGDDFGLNDDINAGIIRAHQQGILTSCSWMAAAPVAEQAAALARANPRLDLGLHLTLVQGRPVLPADKVPSLVEGDGIFPTAYPRVVMALCLGRLNLEEVKREWAAQIELAFSLRLRPTHLDSHQHLHVWPTLMPIAVALAEEFGVPAIRIPDESWLVLRPWTGLSRLVARNALSVLASRARILLHHRGLWCPEHFRGMLAGGHLHRGNLERILNRLLPGITEIMCHPAAAGPDQLKLKLDWGYEWEHELDALTAPGLRERLTNRGVILRGYKTEDD